MAHKLLSMTYFNSSAIYPYTVKKENRMKNQALYTITLIALMTLLSVGGGLVFAADAPLTPEMAAKTEMVRNQQKQRVTPAQRRASADALKLEREKIDQAKKAVAAPVVNGAPSN
jgi:hypothetical protein